MARKRNTGLPPGAWRVEEAIWGEHQRVRLITGLPSIVDDQERVRSIHAVSFLADGRVVLAENKDGSFTFPGGRLEGGETQHQALTRELWEEVRMRLAPGYKSLAATRIEFLNRVPGRVYRVHPTYLLWVSGQVAELSDEPHHDPADSVVGRRLCTAEEALTLLPELERRVFETYLGRLPEPTGVIRELVVEGDSDEDAE
ncbi:NUDIX domain-containing protein [Armatimonas sp.]|uniref:NUDIX domain-containing protein n=1 Tax=Armatimonas sp. TaxID=1872638 RepID=UPI00286CE3D7|nr:NUDIX domain-containing protein [Armatimonas sp.]